MPCSLTGLLLMSFPRIVYTNTLGDCVAQSTQTYSPMYLRHVFRLFFFHYCSTLLSCLLFSNRTCFHSWSLHWFSSPCLFFLMPCSFLSLSLSPPICLSLPQPLLPLWSLTPNSAAVWSRFKGLSSDLVSFCLYSPWSLKKLFSSLLPLPVCLSFYT